MLIFGYMLNVTKRHAYVTSFYLKKNSKYIMCLSLESIDETEYILKNHVEKCDFFSR